MRDSQTDRFAVAIFLLVAGYALIAGLLVQEVVVPTLVGEEGENGLLPILDTATFHEIAVEMSVEMESRGWAAWEWNPGWSANQPVGIMAAVYYWFGPDPIYLLPVNAVFHGLSAVVLFYLFLAIGAPIKASFAGILPFVFFPSTLTWVSQFHKDGLYCLGLFTMFLGCVKILSARSWSARIIGVFCLVVGGFAAGLMRGYGVTVFMVAVLGCGSFLVFATLLSKKRRVSREMLNYVVFIVGLILVSPFSGSKGGNISSGDSEPKEISAVVETAGDPTKARSQEAEKKEKEVGDGWVPPVTPWESSSWLPGPIDRNIHRLIHNRTVFFWLFPESGSLVDADKVFSGAGDVIAYVPRALAIGLFAPFPNMWFEEALTRTGGLQRKVSAVETFSAYLLLAGCIYGLFRWPNREKCFVVLAAVLLVVALVYPVPSVGSLYRLRFGAFSLLLGIGAVSLYQAFLTKRFRGC